MEPISKTLQEIVTHTQVGLPAVPEKLPRHLLPEEMKFMQALTGPCVRQMTATSNVDLLMACMMKVGIRAHQIPADSEFVILLQHLQYYYGDHTPAEVRLAMDLAITGQLDLEPEQIPCYANFSCLYLSTVMNAYRRWVSTRRSILIPDPIPQLTLREDTSDEGMQEWFNQVILSVINENRDPEFLPTQLYDWLENAGRIKLSESEKASYLVKAVWRREEFLLYFSQREGKLADEKHLRFVTMRVQGEFSGDEVQIIRDLAKRIYLKEMILNNKKQPNEQTDQGID